MIDFFYRRTKRRIFKEAETRLPLIFVDECTISPEEPTLQHCCIRALNDSPGLVLHRRTAPSTTVPGKNQIGSTKHQSVEIWPFHLEEKLAFDEYYAIEYTRNDSRKDSENQMNQCLKLHLWFLSQLHPSTVFQPDISTIKVTKIKVGRKRMTGLKAIPKNKFVAKDNKLLLIDRKALYLTSNIAFYQELVLLDLTGNKLKTLPTEIGLLGGLCQLIITNNELVTVPESLCFLKKLRGLFLDNNRLESLPSSIGNLTRLKRLIINNNRVKQLPSGLGALVELIRFEARHNLIEWLPGEMSTLKKLRYFSLEGNPLIHETLVDSIQIKISSSSPGISLKESAARVLLRSESQAHYHALSITLRSYLGRATECPFCHGPILDKFYARIRILNRSDIPVPFMYFLCSSHWTDERSRIRSMFSDLCPLFPKSVVAWKRRDSLPSLMGIYGNSRVPIKSFGEPKGSLTTSQFTGALTHPRYRVLQGSKSESIADINEMRGDLMILVSENWEDVPIIVE